MPIQLYSDFEKRQALLQEKQRELDLEVIRCPKCDSQWFEQVVFARFKADHHIILGQDVPVRPGSLQYTLLRCACCKDLLEPRVLHNTRDVASGDYDHFLDTLEGKHDKRAEQEEEKKEEDALQAEEL